VKEALIISGAAFFLFNYIIGWLLKLKLIGLPRKAHQGIFTLLLLNLSILLFFIYFLNAGSVLLISSILFLILLPFGKKGDIYHIVLSTAGIITYSIFFVIELQL
jgi:hypothetical protein